MHRQFEGSPTFSSLEVQPVSAIIQDLFYLAATGKITPFLNVICEVSILHVYHKEAPVKIPMKVNPLTTVTSNLLGVEKTAIGDPDNSPLTGGGCTWRSVNINFNVYYVIISIVFYHFSNL